MKKILKSANKEHIKEFEGNIIYYVPKGTEEIGEGAFDAFHGNGFPLLNSVTQLLLPNGLKKIGKMAFHDALVSLKLVVIPSSVEEIEEYAFGGLDDLKTVMVTDSTKFIRKDAFVNCRNLTIKVFCKDNKIPVTWDKEWFGNCKYETIKILDPECKVLLLEDIKNKRTAYIELAKGKFKKKHFNSDSIFFEPVDFEPIEVVFIKYIPKYDDTGFFNINKKTGNKIISDLKQIAIADDLEACYITLKLDIDFARLLKHKKDELQDNIKQTINWLERNFEKNKHFCFLGL